MQGAVPGSLITYPCDFPVKVMGRARDDFAPTIGELVRRFDPSFDTGSIAVRASSGGRYLGLTLMVHVRSRLELDALYRALHRHEMVSVVL